MQSEIRLQQCLVTQHTVLFGDIINIVLFKMTVWGKNGCVFSMIPQLTDS